MANVGTAGTSVNLAFNVAYTTTTDGYLIMNGGATAGSAVIVSIYGKNDSLISTIFELTPVANYGSCSATYVKKGAKLLVLRKDTGSDANFVPMTY